MDPKIILISESAIGEKALRKLNQASSLPIRIHATANPFELLQSFLPHLDCDLLAVVFDSMLDPNEIALALTTLELQKSGLRIPTLLLCASDEYSSTLEIVADRATYLLVPREGLRRYETLNMCLEEIYKRDWKEWRSF